MTSTHSEDDSWGQLLSDFGIEDHVQEEAASPEPTAPVDEESSRPKEKKSILSRFPKINFFGAPPAVSLDFVIEGAKSPSLGGKGFTDNKLEKMPVSQERTDRQKKDKREKEPGADAWSTVASQIDVLASGKEEKAELEDRPSRRVVTSIFDDPVPESEELRAVKNLMGDQPRREESDAFFEEESDFRQRGRNRRGSPPEERETRGRGSRYKSPVEVDDLPESDFVPVDEEPPRARGRGRRGSKHDGGGYRDREPIREEAPQEEWSEIDVALQTGRGGRQQRNDQRRHQQRAEKPVIDHERFSDEEDGGVISVHGDVPSWNDAIGDIISGNITRHKGHSNHGRR